MVSQNEVIIDNDAYVLDGASLPTTPIASAAQNPTQSSVHASKQGEGSSKGKKHKGKLDDSVDVFLKRGFETITEALKEDNAILTEVRPRVYSTEEVFAGLQNIGVEQPLLLKAYRFLNTNAGRVREFFGCPTEFRITLLEDIMRDSYI
ncbi:hypothetical protein Droror1_Dr00014025 [Drosera rotundifolia]